MTKLKKQSTSYEVNSVGETLTANGNCRIRENNLIESMYLTFTDKDKIVGSANYSEDSSGSNYSYSISDELYKAEIIAMLDTIVSDVKSQVVTV